MNNFWLLTPEFLVTGLAFILLAVDLFIQDKHRGILPWIAFFGLLIIIGVIVLVDSSGDLYNGVLVFDEFTKYFRLLLVLVAVFIVLMSRDYVKNRLENVGEFYGILIFTLVGAMLLSSSSELLTAYISLELLSFGLYVLVAFDRYNPKSNEAGTKYILLGAFSSAIILYGISHIYGLLGTTKFIEIAEALSGLSEMSPGLILGFVLILTGLLFKLAAVPFHMWAPDVYEGSPVPITAWLSVGSKIAVVALVVRFFMFGFIPAPGGTDWQLIVVLISVATMVIGNLLALVQSNLRRLLAYSSIAHVGYLLMGVAAFVQFGDDGSSSVGSSHLVSNGIIFHVTAYAVTNLAAFMSIIFVYNHTGRDDIKSLAGLSTRQPLVALVLVSALFSLAGLPVFAGFTSKFYLFNAVGLQGLLWLVGVGIVASLISLYYYLMVARQIYIEEAEDESHIPVSLFGKVILSILLILMVIGGIWPQPVMEIIQSATDSVMSVGLIRHL